MNNKYKKEELFSNCTCNLKIYGGDIFINSNENGIDSDGNIHIVGGKLILFGSSDGDYQPITNYGLLEITNGTFLAGGKNINGGVIANTTQLSSTFLKHVEKDSQLYIYSQKNLIINVTIPKSLDYLYFNYYIILR